MLASTPDFFSSVEKKRNVGSRLEYTPINLLLYSLNFECDLLNSPLSYAAQSILLHLAAQTKVMAVLPLVLEEYKRLMVFSAAMLKLNNKNKNPLHVAIAASRYESVVLLFKECVELCPEALQPDDSGE